VTKDVIATHEILILDPNGKILVLAQFRMNITTHFFAEIVGREIKDPDPELRVKFVLHATHSFVETHIAMDRVLYRPRGDGAVPTFIVAQCAI
jgi:hypothetical protein